MNNISKNTFKTEAKRPPFERPNRRMRGDVRGPGRILFINKSGAVPPSVSPFSNLISDILRFLAMREYFVPIWSDCRVVMMPVLNGSGQ